MESPTGSEPPGAASGQPPQPISQHQPQPQTCPAGKLKKSAFRFFSGRKSICMLPSFLVGRARSQTRGISKSGVTKSQTYDGVSRACWDERGGRGDVSSADFEFHDPNSVVDARKLQESFERSQSLPRPKRGLRGFLSSIRRQRKNKNVEFEKRETFEMSAGEVVPPTPQTFKHLSHGDCSESKSNTPSEPVVLQTPSQTSESPKIDMLVPEVCQTSPEKKGQIKSEEEADEGRIRSALVTYQQPLYAESELLRLVELHNELPMSDLPILSASSDNLVFGDVSSLKSFDSLTGCGDIIAEQDDVSMAESSASGERASRGGGKRSSCLVTYQGGGEEMATPDQVDNEYLDSLWESEGSEVCYLPSEQTLSPSTTPDPLTSIGNTGTSPSGVTKAGLTSTNDDLTPQSDRQGSVPNSDEGYYDSTTPGADEEAHDLPPKERLSRDSYSGDALYELFEADDELLSPQVDTKESHGFLGHTSKGDIFYTLETGTMETEEERLSKIQHALLCCDFQNLRNTSEDQLSYRAECFYTDKTSVEASSQHQISKELQLRSLSISDSSNSVKFRSSMQVSETQSSLQDTSMYCEQERSKESASIRNGSQSQEDLMVCFSQALVDFNKSSRRYRDSTESLDGSMSSSPFGPSLSALPAIVTFDVVDMENEGECEKPEPTEEEEVDLTSPFEEFDDDSCYLQQDAFAECDHRTFDAYEQSLLFSHAWGIASLPRHLSLSRAWPPVPAPLSLNRRSRSLDTDSLELQTSELYALFLARRSKGFSLQRKKDEPNYCDLALPHLPVRDPKDNKRPGHGCEFNSGLPLEGSPWMEDSPHASGSQPSIRPSYLPLQMTYFSNSTAQVDKTSTEQSDLYPCSYPPAGKIRPIGVTQGIPHLRSDQSSSAREIPSKSRRTDIEVGVSSVTEHV